jgi:restriction endonuclease S subunit
MTYKLPSNIDPSKVFLINRSELEGRIDPNQYHIERKEAIAKLKKNNQLLKLKDVVKNVKTTTTQVSESDIYIGLENITSNTGEYIETKDKLSISSAGIFKKGQILFPKLRPYLNKVYLAEFDGICSTEFHIFKSDTFLNEFLTIYLRSDLIVNQTKHLMTGNTLPRLQTDDINNLPVPNISIEKQQQIVDLYNIAYSQKQQKEAQANLILKSIDTYLLKELGITLPEKDNSLTNRIFRTSFSEVTGGRFDPDYIAKHNYLVSREAKFDFIDFKNVLIKSPQYGANEEAIDGDLNNDTRYIRITDIDDWGNLKKDTWKTANNINPVYILNNDDILIARTGATVGKSFIYKKNKFQAIFAGYMIRFIIDKKKANPDYIFYYLNSSFYKFWISAIQRPSAQPNINSEEYKSLPIALPPLEKQTEIVNYILSIRNQARQLQKEALGILDKAKQQVEKIILG